MKKIALLRTILILLLVSWMVLIFFMSAQPAVESSKTSHKFVNEIIELIYDDFEELTIKQQESITNTITLVVRKTAHFLEYFILGLFASLFAATFSKAKGGLKFTLAAVFSVLYAVSDEVHQHFVPGRACRALDIGIDSLGIVCAVVLVALIVYVIGRRKSGERKVKKKELIEQNLSLFEQLQKTKGEIIELKKLLDASANEIGSLKQELVEMKAVEKTPVVTEPLRRLEEKVIANAMLKPDMEYASVVIGKLVVAAAEHSNNLTVGGDESKKELVNLILGKTEIAKAEILSVVESGESFENKCAKIDQIADVTKEYFESVIAQIV